MSKSKRKKNTEQGKNLVQEETHLKQLEATNVSVIFGEIRKKTELEIKAFAALDRRLERRPKMCKKCNGKGEVKDQYCGLCEGDGFMIEDPDMRAIELVLAPKFPKTQVNINADLEGMSTEDLLRMIDKM